MKLSDRYLEIPLLLLAGGLRLHRAGILGTQADEGVHLFVASQVARGLVVYRDLFENRTPLVEWFMALFFKAAGTDLFVARVLTILAGLLTMAAAIAIVRLSGGARRAGLLGPLLFALSPLAIFWGRFTLLEPYSVALSVLSLAAALRASRQSRLRWWLFSGLLAGLALLAKQTALVFVAILFVYLLRYAKRPLLAWVMAVLAVLVTFAAVLFGQQAWRPFTALVSGADRVSFDISAAHIISTWLPWARSSPLPLLFAAAMFLALASRRYPSLLLGAWALAEATVLLFVPDFDLSWGGISHYALPLLAAMSLLIGATTGALRTTQRAGQYAVLGAGLLSLLTTPGWWQEFRYAAWETTYPHADRSAELQVGHALDLLAPPGAPVVVLGNAGFYLTADRPAASRYFHYPGYLSTSDLAPRANEAITTALSDPKTAAVAVSGLHLAERLPQELTAALWQHWNPVTRVSYPYQRDVFIWRRRAPVAPAATLAEFADEVALHRLHATQLGNETLLVTLDWEAARAPQANYVAFVHLLDSAGNLIAQHDGVPVMGFRPTTSWQSGEQIVDEHWLDLPYPVVELNDTTISVGLYRPENVTRLDRSDRSGQNSYSMPLESATR